ncbi:hypothetical protein [Mesorhizobium sp. M1365]|uniref:hypothetical protein n=1 Tax=Mesorhizobium sp. M1365 TaxID=2957090 RepID=UPI003338025A
MKIKVYALTVVCVLSGCATRSLDIKSAPVTSSAYAGKSCSQLEGELYKMNSDLAPIMAEQDRTARHDVDGVFWVGLPVGSMMDKTDIKAREAKIAEMKGNMDAINAARRKGGCVSGTL